MDAQQAFADAVATITARIAGKPIDGSLQPFLDENFPPGGEAFDDLAELCRQGVDDGWLCDKGRFGYQAIHSTDRITQPLIRLSVSRCPIEIP